MKHFKMCVSFGLIIITVVGSFKAKDIGNPMIAKIRAEKEGGEKG